MNILIAQKIDGAFQKVAIYDGLNKKVGSGRLLYSYLAKSAFDCFSAEPAASLINYTMFGVDYRVSKF